MNDLHACHCGWTTDNRRDLIRHTDTCLEHWRAETFRTRSEVRLLRKELAASQAEIQRLATLAYLGEHHFPYLTWKVRCEEATADLVAAEARAARLAGAEDLLRRGAEQAAGVVMLAHETKIIEAASSALRMAAWVREAAEWLAILAVEGEANLDPLDSLTEVQLAQLAGIPVIDHEETT